MNVLITGSNGFVGSHLAKELVSRGHQVIGLGRSAKSAVDGIAYIQHDLRHPLDLSPWGTNFDAIIHCAALASPWAAPTSFQENNVTATRNVVQAACSSGKPHLIYISSTSVYYENRDQTGIHEETPMPPLDRQINEYSRTKLLGEKACQSYEGLLTILRPRAIFGPRDTVLLPRILEAAAKGKLPRLTRSDGCLAVGDLIYIDTLVSYITKAAEDRITGTYNLTNNEPVAISAFVDDILRRFGYPLPTKKIPVNIAMALARLLEMFSRVFLNYREPPVTQFGISVFAYSKTFDAQKMLSHLGQPKVSVGEGVDALLRWWNEEGKSPC